MLSLFLEKKVWRKKMLVGGLDEAGRGAWAGPVVAACVVMPPDFIGKKKYWEIINDSKKMTAKSRENAFLLIQKFALSVGIGQASQKIIDQKNILNATWQAMRRAIKNTKKNINLCLIDGSLKIPGIKQKQITVIKGDSRIFSIAAASIVAKVTRDRVMKKYDRIFPKYGFGQNVGYGTKLHAQALCAFGPCGLHRQSFKPVKLWLAGKKN